MAKRKRLTPAQPAFLEEAPAAGAGPGPGLSGGAAAPIAQVAGDSAARAALEELAGEMQAARAGGRMVELIPLEAIDTRYLVRDRLVQDEDELEALTASIRARGQKTPIEVAVLTDHPEGLAFGLVSGWRRLSALKRLYSEASEPEFAAVKALVVRPDSAAGAYVAMVEENEMRVNLSHYERARIALKALGQGVYSDRKAALQGLFGNVPRAKRSKIGSFMALVDALDDVLHFPASISEKLGLALVRRMAEEADFAADLKDALHADPRRAVEAELSVLNRCLAAGEKPAASSPATAAEVQAPRPRARSASDRPAAGERLRLPAGKGITLSFTAADNRIELTGKAVDAVLMEALQDWLKSR